MKRSLIITIGIVCILLICGLWVYLLVYGAPKEARDVFTNLGVVKTEEGTVREIEGNVPQERNALLGISGGALEQLTTKAVAGFSFSTTSNMVRYVERGTGHIFEIDLNTGVEKQISLTTVPQTVSANFSPLGSYVAFTVYDTYSKLVSVGFLDKEERSLELTQLPQNVENIAFENEKTLYYTLQENDNTVGYSFDTVSLAKVKLFDVVPKDADMYWGNGFDTIYAQTKPTAYLEGFLYSVSKNTLTPISNFGYGLTSLIGNNHIITSHVVDDEYISVSHTSATTTRQPIVMFKEKCAFDLGNPNGVWCAIPLATTNSNYLEDWYKGKIVSEDFLWFTDLTSQTATLVGDLGELSGRDIDVTSLTNNKEGTLLLFTNKTDQTLWLYRVEL